MLSRLGAPSRFLFTLFLPVFGPTADAPPLNLRDPAHPTAGGPAQRLKSRLAGFADHDVSAEGASAVPTESEVRAKLPALTLPFIANEGQIDTRVAFYASTFAGTVFVTKAGEIVYSLPGSVTGPQARSRPSAGACEQPSGGRDARPGWTLVERFADGRVSPRRGASLETRVSYFLGNEPARWQPHVPTYASVQLGEVWPGIEVSLNAYGRNVEKVYRVGAGVSSEPIRMNIAGAVSLRLADDGALVVVTELGELRFRPPVAYQDRESGRVSIEVGYRLVGSGYGFRLGGCDPHYPVVIDPLLQSTYLGGSDQDRAEAVFVTGSAVYVAGDSFSTNFPGTAGGAQPNSGGGGSDVFVARLNLALTSLDQATYVGGNSIDVATTLFVVGNEVFVAGDTFSTNFPGTAGGAQPNSGGGGNSDGFVARLTLALTGLNQATYLGGSDVDRIRTLHASGSDVFVAGHTASTNFPGTAGGAQPSFAGGTIDGDGFVARLNVALTSVSQATYLGGSGSDAASSLSVAGSEVFVAGETRSANFPATAGGAQPGYGGGGTDGFVARLNLALTTLNQATHLGGSNFDVAYPVLVAGSDVFVAGYTSSSNFPGTAGGAQPSYGGGANDTFVARLNLGLTALNQATYLGGSDGDFIDPSTPKVLFVTGSEVFVAATTASTNFPGTGGGAQPGHGGGLFDAYVARLDRTLTALNQATYLGGSASDVASAFFVIGTDVFVAGTTFSTDFPGTAGGAQGSAGGGQNDSFVARMTYDLSQCGLRDNLDGGPCCTATSVVLPQFPSTSASVKYICFRDCGIRINGDVCVSINAPVPAQVAGTDVCGVFLIPYSIKTCGGNPTILWSGTMRAHYSRNWMASSEEGGAPDTEVWRLLLNGDLIPSAFLIQRFASNPAVVPPCIAAFNNRAHFWGYIDYARNCRTGVFATAWALNHDCDSFEHGPTSARPGAFHPGLSYDFVGPANGFVVDPSSPPLSFGGIAQEAVRKNDWAAAPAICLLEEPVQGVMDFGIPYCPCETGSSGGSQFLTAFLQAQGNCGTTLALAPNAPIPLVRKRVGNWTNGAIYPGVESLLLEQGFLTFNDGCGSGSLPDQYFKGVETLGGFPAFHIGPALTPLGQHFQDLGSANRSPGNVSPKVGAPYVTHYILNLNIQ